MIGLSLPLDIPWKRLCVSEDSIARFTGDRAGSKKWKSSIAVFEHTPGEEYQTYEGMTVSYLKVAATLTGFQPEPSETGLQDRRIRSAFSDPLVIEEYEKAASKYYGCYGAILEVIVTPKNAPDLPLDQFPYFADFEPKKRELYEVVTDTGEVMSRSLEGVGVRKGASTSDSHEVLDSTSVNLGVSGSVSGVTGSLGVQQEHGTKDLSQQGYENVRTTDSARESRETFAHTTQLTQMYHQLSSYHLGTNRAIFFVLPRPHIVESERTFINGPRVLEGIQEFFLVVMRPKAVAEICVEAYLETAHLVNEPVEFAYETAIGALDLKISLPAPEVPFSLEIDSARVTKKDAITYLPPAGWEIDLERSGDGVQAHSAARTRTIRPNLGDFKPQLPDLNPILPNIPHTTATKGYRLDMLEGSGILFHKITAERDHVIAEGEVEAKSTEESEVLNPLEEPGRLDMRATIFIRNKNAKVAAYDQTMYITSRGVSSCPVATVRAARPSVVFEHPVSPVATNDGRMSITQANRVRTEIGQLLMESLNHPDRRPHGDATFTETRFLGRMVSTISALRGQPESQAGKGAIAGLDTTTARKILAIAPNVTRSRLLTMDLREMADRFQITPQEVARVRRAALGLEGTAPPPDKKWNRPATRTPATKPTAPREKS